MIDLQEISEEDIEFLYSILKERKPEESIDHVNTPTYIEHEKFVKSKPYTIWYKILQNNKKIGTIYLSQEDEVGIFIKKEFQKKKRPELIQALFSESKGI